MISENMDIFSGVLPGKVAVVQICVDNSYCDVMQIIHSGIPQSLQHLIEDSTLVKVCLTSWIDQSSCLHAMYAQALNTHM